MTVSLRGVVHSATSVRRTGKLPIMKLLAYAYRRSTRSIVVERTMCSIPVSFVVVLVCPCVCTNLSVCRGVCILVVGCCGVVRRSSNMRYYLLLVL